jgi:hypothetical protein
MHFSESGGGEPTGDSFLNSENILSCKFGVSNDMCPLIFNK